MKQAGLSFVILSLLFSLLGNSASALEKVTLQLRWDHQFQFAGYYAAKWNGYYEDAGFDVEIKSAVQSRNRILSAVEEVAEGRADFGIGAADVLLARQEGVPLVILASIFQKSPAGFYFKKSTKVGSLADLVNLRVARQVDSLIDIEFQAMLKSEGIDPKLIEPYPHQAGFDHLLNDEIDVMPGYSLSVPYALKNLDLRFNVLNPWGYGIDFYGDSLFTHQRVIDKDPEAIKKFIAATKRGWSYALQHSEEMVKRIATTLPRVMDQYDLLELNRFQVDGVKDLMLYPYVDIGHINPDRWQKMNDHLKRLGIVKGDLDLWDFIFDPDQREKEAAEQFRKISIFITAGIVCIAAVIAIWIFLLRRTVAARTADLSGEISERKRIEQDLRSSEERFRNLVNTMNSGVAIYRVINEGTSGNDYIVQEFNKFALEHEGLRQEEVVGKSLKDIRPNIDEYGLIEVFRKVWKTRKPEFFPATLYSDQKFRNYYENRVFPLPSGEIVAIYDDVTKRVQAERQLKASLKEKETVLQEIHHRVKNNMQVIASLLRLQMIKEKSKHSKELLQENIGRIYAMSTIHESLYQSEDLSDIDFKSYLTKLTHVLLQNYSLTPDKVSFHVESPDVRLTIDKVNPLSLVLNELISNSLKYAFPDGKNGAISIHLEKPDPKTLQIVISDNGIGIPPQHSLQNPETLGLRLVHDLVENQLEGTIDLDRTNGTKYTITLSRIF